MNRITYPLCEIFCLFYSSAIKETIHKDTDIQKLILAFNPFQI